MTAALQLLVTLTGVTLLFGCAQANGTSDRVILRALRLCRRRTSLLPALFFALAAAVATVGPGAILSTAFVAPFAMNAGTRAGLSPFLIALMVCNGANAGNLSPFSTVGAIAGALMAQNGLAGYEFRVWFFHAAAHVLVAVAGLLLFVRRTAGGAAAIAAEGAAEPPIEGRHAFTISVTAAWIASVVLLRMPLGWSALAAAAILLVSGAAPLREALSRMPWKVIALVTGISTVVGFAEKAGGFEWLKQAVAAVSNPRSVHGVLALLTGVISAYSSTSGVVLPAFLPLAAGIAERVPGTDALALSITAVIGSSLVDVSPLSTLGALCIAATAPEHGPGVLFRQLMAWGLSMTLVGAAFCYLGSPWFSPR
jgi:hypothetical protein